MDLRAAFLLMLLLFSPLRAGEALRIPFEVHEGQRIERVITRGRESIRPAGEKGFYRGNLPEALFTEARRFRGKHGSFYLLDLSREGKPFDALPYDELQIDTDARIFRVALADEVLAGKESNRIIGRNRHRISLKPFYRGLDMQRLKYVVILTEAKLSRLRVVFRKRPLPPKMQRKPSLSVWAWHPGRVNPDRLERAGIRRIYLQVGSRFSEAANRLKAMRSPPEIYALDGSPGDIYRASKVIGKLSRLPLKKLRGIQLDVEPYLLPEYFSDRERTLKRYLKMLKRVGAWCRRKGLRFSVVIPHWFDRVRFSGKPLLPMLLHLVDEAVLMSYRSEPAEVLRISADTLRQGEELGKRIALGVELRPVEEERHILYRVGPTGPCITRRFFHLRCRELTELRRYRVPGSRVSFAGRPAALKRLLRQIPPYRSFDGFVLHDYSMLQRFEAAIE